MYQRMMMEAILPAEERNKWPNKVFTTPKVPKKWSQLTDDEKTNAAIAILNGSHNHQKYNLVHQKHELVEQLVHYILFQDEYPIKGWEEMDHTDKVKAIEAESKTWKDQQIIKLLKQYMHKTHLKNFETFYDNINVGLVK